MKAVKTRRKGKPAPRAATPPQPGLDESSRAQLGRDPEQRPYRPRKEDASVEDPLQDWPEDG